MESVNKISKTVGVNLDKLLKNKSVFIVLSLVLVLYAGGAAPALPDSVVLFFDSILGKTIFIFLIGFMASKNVQVALFIAIAFVITLQIANRRRLENYVNYTRFRNVESFYDTASTDNSGSSSTSSSTSSSSIDCSADVKEDCDSNDCKWNAEVPAVCNAIDEADKTTCADLTSEDETVCNANDKCEWVAAVTANCEKKCSWTTDTECAADSTCEWGKVKTCNTKDSAAPKDDKKTCADLTSDGETGCAADNKCKWEDATDDTCNTKETFTNFHGQIENFDVMPANNLNGDSGQMYAPVKFD